MEEDKERVKGLKEDLLEEAQRELIRVWEWDWSFLSFTRLVIAYLFLSFFLQDKTNISTLFGVNTSVNTSYASPRPVKLKEPKEKKKSLFAKKEVKKKRKKK